MFVGVDSFFALFQSTLSVRRATRTLRQTGRWSFVISIHALREESDTAIIKF